MNRNGNLKGEEKYNGYTYEDLPKITVRNTLDNVENNANLKGRNKLTQFPDQSIKTIRELTENNEHLLGPSREKGDAEVLRYTCQAQINNLQVIMNILVLLEVKIKL